jgi:transposase-like protein
MAKEEKLKIFKLFEKGATVPELEKTTNINRRTLYRWYKEFEQNQTMQPVKEAVQAVKVQVEQELNDIDFSQDWIKIISKNSINGCLVNMKIRERLSDVLLNELDQPDLNFRAIAALSSCINIHARLERDFGMYYMLDPNVAIKRIESEGYIIQNPADEPITIDNSDLAGMTPEQLSQEYKKLISAS